MKIIHNHKYDNTKQFFKAIAQGLINVDDVLTAKQEKEDKEKLKELQFSKFANSARGEIGGILVDGKKSTLLYNYAKCCNPIPGDPIVGFITIGEGIKIHRKNCINLINLSMSDSSKLAAVQWPETESNLFVAGILIRGQDRLGILNDISHSILTYQNTNIKSININTQGSSFEGNVAFYVQNLEHFNRIMERLKKISGVSSVERFEGSI
jgi:(p)ppGpp synthase/HD superfamily hydrolase